MPNRLNIPLFPCVHIVAQSLCLNLSAISCSDDFALKRKRSVLYPAAWSIASRFSSFSCLWSAPKLSAKFFAINCVYELALSLELPRIGNCEAHENSDRNHKFMLVPENETGGKRESFPVRAANGRETRCQRHARSTTRSLRRGWR